MAVDEDGTLVFVDATVRIGTDDFPEAHRARGLREALAATWLAGNGDDYADTPVRFNEVAMMVVKENQALLRHHVNCFGEMEPLSRRLARPWGPGAGLSSEIGPYTTRADISVRFHGTFRLSGQIRTVSSRRAETRGAPDRWRRGAAPR